MRVYEIKSAVSSLSREEFMADAGEQQIEAGVKAGKLDHLAAEADEDFKDGRCTPL